MSNQSDSKLSGFTGLLLGLLAGWALAVLFAPKSGEELQDDVKDYVSRLPDEWSEGLTKSKGRYKEMVGKTRYNLETKLEQRNLRGKARRMAKAKQREEQDSDGYEVSS